MKTESEVKELLVAINTVKEIISNTDVLEYLDGAYIALEWIKSD
jgi:hypothetical protein